MALDALGNISSPTFGPDLRGVLSQPSTAGSTQPFRTIGGVTQPSRFLDFGSSSRQQTSGGATAGVGGGSFSGGVAGEPIGSNTVNYMANLLFERLAPSGIPGQENVQKAFLPIELQWLRQLGIQGTTTSEIFEELGLGEVLTSGIDPSNSGIIRNNLMRSLTERVEGGDRSVGGPQFGGASLATGPSATPDEIGATGAAFGALAGPAGAIGAGALGLGALATKGMQALQDFTGRPAINTAPRPQFTTTQEKLDFADALGKNIGPGDVSGVGISSNAPPDRIGRGNVGNGTASGSGLGPGTGRAGSVGGANVGGGFRDPRDRGGEGGGGTSGGGGSRDAGSGRGGSRRHTGGLVYDEGYAHGGLIRRGYALGGEIEGDPGMAIGDVLGGLGGGGDPSFTPRPAGGAPDDVSITAQQGEYVIARPAIEALGIDFFNVLNDIFLKNPTLDPKAGLKAASAVIKAPESETSVAQPGQNIGEQIGAAIPSPGGPFAAGGLIGARPVAV